MTNQPNDHSAPWRMDCERGWISIADSRGLEVCYLEAYDEEDQDRQLANARLIKAAPEMRQMLQDILCMVEAYGIVTLRDNAANDIRGLLEQIRGGEINDKS